jgi:hypothetical protein
VVALGSLVIAGSAIATHEVPSSSGDKTLHYSIVPSFKQCGTGANPSNGQHSPPLGVPSCLPPKPTSTIAFAGAAFVGTADITVRNDSSDVDLVGVSNDVRSGSPTGPPFNGSIGSTSRIRFSDHYNCSGLGCTGPYTTAGTGTDTDFGPVPVTCSSGNCSVTTSANSVLPGSVVPGKQAVIDVFRLRVNDNFPSGNILGHQGIYIP